MLLRTTGIAKGGDAIAREPDGRVVFVAGALPGETVEVELTERRRDFARARVLAVVEASAGRVAPPCPGVAAGCGGCDLQHASPELQRVLKRDVVVDALRRIGRVADPPEPSVVALAVDGYRTTLRAVVDDDGRVALRRRSSHEPVALHDCLVLHPLLGELVASARFAGAHEVTLRCGARTGERTVLVDPADAPAPLGLPAGVAVGPAAVLHEVVDGVRLRVSATSFFQARADGADALVAAVRDALGDALDASATLLDAYAGVGLFAATVGREAGRVVAVEQAPSSVADMRHNLAARDATVVGSSFESWRPVPVDVAVADPARSGLGRDGVGVLAATGARRVALVSCDPAALGRDTMLLAQAGYALRAVTIVDLFGHTSHVEVVSTFDRLSARR